MSNAVATKQQPKTFIELITSQAVIGEAMKVAPGFMDPVRLFRIAQTVHKGNEKLQRCDPMSIMGAVMDACTCGLYVDGRNAHLVPYGKSCKFIPDYKGLMQLGQQHPDVANWRAETVHEHDTFEHNKGKIIVHTWALGQDRGEPIGYYSEITFTSGQEDAWIIDKAHADSIKKRSAAGGAGPWITDYNSMAMKTAVKAHSKYKGHLLTKEFQEAVDRDYDNLPNAKDVTAEVSQKATEHLKRLDDTAPESTSASEGQDKVEEVVVDPVPIAEPDEDDIPMDSTPPPGPTDSSSLIRSIIGKLQKHKGKSAIETGLLRNKRLQEVATTIPEIEDVGAVTTVTFKSFPASILELINDGLGD